MDQPNDPNQQQHIMNDDDDEPMDRSIKQEVSEDDDYDDDDDDEYYEEQLIHDNSPSHDSQAGGPPDGDDAFASSYSLPPTVDPGEQHFSNGNNGQDYEEDEQSNSDVRENEPNLPEPNDTMQSAQMSEPGLNVPKQSNGYVPRPLVNDVLVGQDLAALSVPPMTPSESTLTANAMGFLRGTYHDDPDIADRVTENVVLVGDFIGDFYVNCEGSFEGMFREVHLREFKCVFKGKVTEGFLRGTFRGAIERLLTGETHFEGRFSGVLVGDFNGRMRTLADALQTRNDAMRAYRRQIRLPTRVQSVAPSMDAQSVNDDEMMEHSITVHQSPNLIPNDQLSDAHLPEPSNYSPEPNALSDQDDIQSVNQSHLSSSAESSVANDSETDNEPVAPDTQQQQQQHQRKLRKSSRINSRQKQPRAQSPPPTAALAVEVKRSRISAPESSNHSTFSINRRDVSSTKIVIFVECPDPECDDQFDTFKELDEHMASSHNQLRHPCFVAGCTEQFAKNAVAGHIKSKHPRATKFFCPVSNCGKEYTTQKAAGAHYKLHTKGQFKCKMCTCNGKMISLSTARQHLNTRSEGAWSGCESQVCGTICFTLLSLKSHQNDHFRKKELRCCTFGQCTLCSFNTSTILGHLQTAHRVEISVQAQSLAQYTEILSESLLDRKLKALSKQRQSKLPMSSSSAASARFNYLGPSTSGIQPSRHVDDSDDDDFIVTSKNKQTQNARKTQIRSQCIVRDLTQE